MYPVKCWEYMKCGVDMNMNVDEKTGDCAQCLLGKKLAVRHHNIFKRETFSSFISNARHLPYDLVIV
jgi:hypothetical protein